MKHDNDTAGRTPEGLEKAVDAYLDGELPADTLEGAAGREAEAWDRLVAAFRSEAPAAPAPPWLETRVMAEIEALPEPGALGRVWRWLVRPRPMTLSPLAGGLAVAALATLLLLRPGTDTGTPAGGTAAPGTVAPTGVPGAAAVQPAANAAGGPLVYVQFVLQAPGASSVAVAGDFDGWQGSYALTDLDGDGVWTGRVPVRPGVHAYMFVVNGSEWVTDPNAERYADDGFGNRNAVLAVTAPSA